MKNTWTSLLFCLLFSVPVLSQTPCNPHPLFNILPEHSISGCDEKEYDMIKVDFVDKNGIWVQHEKAGYSLKTFYTFEGDFEKRPSNPMIFQNYIQAITSKGGSVVNESNAKAFLYLKSAGESWWIYIQSDRSGTYSVTCVREETMNQYIVLSAEDIARELKTSGKATFYGIYFDTDQADIKPESNETLEQMAKYLNANPQVNVYIVGHTDNTGAFEYNQKLSEKRAEAVVQELISKFKVSANRLTAYGLSSLSPIANNTSEEGKGKNRRVEMVLR